MNSLSIPVFFTNNLVCFSLTGVDFGDFLIVFV
jgi:hypothetical protein